MKFLQFLLVSLLAFTLAACNFSLAEDITRLRVLSSAPILRLYSHPEIVTPAASTSSGAATPAASTPASGQTGVTAAGVTVSGKVTNGSGAGSQPA